jgi:hypothetical protein
MEDVKEEVKRLLRQMVYVVEGLDSYGLIAG